ncbi:MAG: hypothetical protein JSW58_09950 [Candidatus Latescibacterota bacterium]|nr:MAG: hypothetical protein JSW58_09950 [Candidatus Latescibacterota bacterium]
MLRVLRLAFTVVIFSFLAITMSGCPDASIPDMDVTYVSVECLNECVDDAAALQMTILAVPEVGIFPDGVSWMLPSNAVPPVVVEPIGGSRFCVTFQFDPPVPLHESVLIMGDFWGGYTDVLMSNAVFLNESPVAHAVDKPAGSTAATACDTVPPCPRGSAPGFQVSNDPILGLVLEVFNAGGSSGGPMTLEQFQWVSVQDTVPPSQLVWGDPLVESLPWIDPSSNLPVTMNPGEQPLIFDIPDNTLEHGLVVLVRSHSTAQGIEIRGILQVRFSQPVDVQRTNWGRIKGKYKDD